MNLHVLLPAGTGIVLILIALPLLFRRIGPNGIYGLRIPATFADEWVWYEANAKSARDMCVLGVVLVVAGWRRYRRTLAELDAARRDMKQEVASIRDLLQGHHLNN